MNTASRRHFIKSVATATGAAAVAATPLSVFAKAEKKARGGQFTDIEHVVLVMMENRSFDHFLGWLPGANGIPAGGLTYPDRSGVLQPIHPLAPDYQGLGFADPDHSHVGGLIEYNNGRCDGWLRAGLNDLYSIGYYTQSDLAFLGQAAPAWTTCDSYFAAILAETYPNRIYQHAAQTDRLINTLTPSLLPTIWDRLAEKRISARYYFSDVPVLALWGPKYVGISRFTSQFFADCASGTLPAVSFVDPSLLGEEEGLSNDDHPHADIRNGEVFLNKVYEAVTTSPNWPNTLLIINFDEWGGFFDHVPPPRAPIPTADRLAGDETGLRGFRVPALAISPWSRRGFVAKGVYDHTSILKLIEARWKLRTLTVRDSTAASFADVLDFANPNYDVPHFVVPPGPFGTVTPPPATTAKTATVTPASSSDEWVGVADMAKKAGFRLR